MPSCHSIILPPCYSIIMPFHHSAILSFHHSAILPFYHSINLPLNSPTTQRVIISFYKRETRIADISVLNSSIRLAKTEIDRIYHTADIIHFLGSR